MTGQFSATHPVSKHHPAAESFAHVSMASSIGHWASYGRNYAYISDSVGLSTLCFFAVPRDAEGGVKPGSHAGHLHRPD